MLIRMHLPCVGCRYDLFALELEAHCPECGSRIQDSFDSRRLIFIGRRLLRQLAAFNVLWCCEVLSFPLAGMLNYWNETTGTLLIIALVLIPLGLSGAIGRAGRTRKTNSLIKIVRIVLITIAFAYIVNGAYYSHTKQAIIRSAPAAFVVAVLFGAPPIALHVLMLGVAKRQSSRWLVLVHSLALFLWIGSFVFFFIFQGASVHRLVFSAWVAAAPTCSITASLLHANSLLRMRRHVD